MNDLGWVLAWLTAQVAVILVPALVLQALASRRGPASGAWVATLSLGLVVALAAVALLPRALTSIEVASAGAARAPLDGTPSGRGGSSLAPTTTVDRPDRPSSGAVVSLERLRRSWTRMVRRAAGPVGRFRGWGKTIAIACLVGTGVGSTRLLVGLWAIGACLRRGRPVDDPGLTALVDELRISMGCRRGVVIREVPDLATPATAGWRRPMLLLPADWRSWDGSERRAVVAHELAHIIRGDYAAGLLARIAVVLNYHHPLVRRMAARLQLEQELAADAMGARFAGGRAAYLVALSRLALKQDGRSPSWPARAFLPARGTLIRRIKMLKIKNESRIPGRGWTRMWRLATALGLISMTIGVATLKAPAKAGDEAPTPPASAEPGPPEGPAVATPVRPIYVRDTTTGLVMFRPAAILRRSGMAWTLPQIGETVGMDLSDLAKDLQVDPSRPGFLKLGVQDIESVTLGVDFIKTKNEERDDLHGIAFGAPTVRTVAPFDWLAFLRQWRMELEEVRHGGRMYYKVTSQWAADLGRDPCVYLPDDRTIILDEEKSIRLWLEEKAPAAPAFLQGSGWDRASRGLFAVAINNQDGKFAKSFDLGRPDDALILPLFSGVDRWVFGVADADPIAPRAEVTGRDPRAAESVARSIKMLAGLGLEMIDADASVDGKAGRAIRMYKGVLANLTTRQAGSSLVLSTGEFGTFADLAAILKAEIEGEKAREAKAGPKAEKR